MPTSNEGVARAQSGIIVLPGINATVLHGNALSCFAVNSSSNLAVGLYVQYLMDDAVVFRSNTAVQIVPSESLVPGAPPR
jgi:hypothetical protein